MYTKEEIGTRSKANVMENGEVFTPFAIVDQMVALVPDKAWADPEYCFLEPTCGNGQILVKIFERRVSAGISIEDALNTLIGMDITKQNINESASRLFERAASEMRVQGMEQGSEEWFQRAATIVAIVANNVFQVKDSLTFIQRVVKSVKKVFQCDDSLFQESSLDKRLFFAIDPTGNNQVQPKKYQKERLNRVHKEFKKSKPNIWLAPFFAKKESVV